MKGTVRSLVLLALLLLGSRTVLAQVPRTMSYQGVLTDAGGTLIADGNHTLTLSLYDAASGGSALWTESQTIPVVRGTFNVLLGTVTPIPGTLAFDRAYFLGVSVDAGTELSPRTPLTAAPYALYAARAGQADALSPGASGVVTSLNGADGALTLMGGGSTTVNRSGNTITISSTGGSGGTGIQGVQSSDAAISVSNGTGPIASLALVDGGIGSSKLADGAVTVGKISNTGALTGDVLTFNGSNVVWASASSGLTLPYSGSIANSSNAFSVTTSGTGSAGIFRSTNTAPNTSALYGEVNATSPSSLVAGVEGKSTNGFGVIGHGGAASTGIYGTVITTPTAGAFIAGSGVSGFSDIGNGISGITYNSSRNGVYGTANGTGTGVRGASTAGTAGVFEITTSSNTSNALEATTNGTGRAILATNTAPTGSTAAVVGEASSTSTGAGASSGVSGVIGRIPSTSPGGYSAGVRGVNNGTSGTGIGVIGYQAGSGWGVYGETPSGFGVYGLTTNNSAISVGVRGETFSPNGIGVEAKYSGTGVGVALELDNGALRVAGVNKAAFVHTATVANKLSANGTDIDNPMCNGDPNAILIVTQKLNPSGLAYNNSPIGVYYNTIRSKWEIFNENSTAITTNAQFNVLVIKQ